MGKWKTLGLALVGADRGVEIDRAYLFLVTPGTPDFMKRPVAKEVFVLHFEDAGVVIPWPKGMTVKEAVLSWARAQVTAPPARPKVPARIAALS